MERIITPKRLFGTDEPDFKALFPDATIPLAGYVTGLSAMAFIASRSDWFAGATMAYEELEPATRGGVYAYAAWHVTKANLSHFFPQAKEFEIAEKELRNYIESGEVSAIAKPYGGERSQPLEAYAAADWSLIFEDRVGLVLIPGYWDLKVDVAKLRRAVPAPPPEFVAPRGGKFIKMADKLRPIFERNYERWAPISTDPERARYIKAVLHSSPHWRAPPPDVKTIRSHWDHFIKTRK